MTAYMKKFYAQYNLKCYSWKEIDCNLVIARCNIMQGEWLLFSSLIRRIFFSYLRSSPCEVKFSANISK